MQTSVTAVANGLKEGLEIFEPRRLAFVGSGAQVVVNPAVGITPCYIVPLFQLLAEPFPYQWVGIQCVRLAAIRWRKKAYVSEPRDGALPFPIFERNDMISESLDRGFDAQRSKTV